MTIKNKIIPTFTYLLLSMIWLQADAVECGDEIYANVRLTADLDCSGMSQALKIKADNVTVDLNGFMITGTYGSGIYAYEQSGLTVKGNGIITGFWDGVYVSEGNRTSVYDTIFYKVRSGVTLSNEEGPSNNNVISDNLFFDVDRGLRLISSRVLGSVYSKNNLIENNQFYLLDRGMYLCGIDESTIRNNQMWRVSDTGIYLNASHQIKIQQNDLSRFELTGDRGNGIVLEKSNSNLLESNRIEDANTGILLVSQYGSHGCAAGTDVRFNTIKYNSIFENERGITLGDDRFGAVHSVDFNQLTGNKIYNNDIGLLFWFNTLQNDARNNTFIGPVDTIDFGVSNMY